MRLPLIAVPFEQRIFHEFSWKLCLARENSNRMTWNTVIFGNKATCLHMSSLEKQFLGKTHLIFKRNYNPRYKLLWERFPVSNVIQRTHAACSLVPTFLNPSPVSSLTTWKEWSLSCRESRYLALASYQWRSQDIAVARAQHGHTTFVRTSARSAEALGGSEGILQPPGSVLRPYTVAKCKSLMVNARMRLVIRCYT